jgi:hypothetical protein
MPVYLFHLCRRDGSSPAFEAFEIASEADVLARAKRMLDQHASCDHVDVWQEDDFIMRLDRETSIARQGSATR